APCLGHDGDDATRYRVPSQVLPRFRAGRGAIRLSRQARNSGGRRGSSDRGRREPRAAVGWAVDGRDPGPRAVGHSLLLRHADSADRFTDDGWFRTGDVAAIDPEGYVIITDRTKDLIKSGGEWISSIDVETMIMGHPKVLEAAVIAVPHPRWV